LQRRKATIDIVHWGGQHAKGNKELNKRQLGNLAACFIEGHGSSGNPVAVSDTPTVGSTGFFHGSFAACEAAPTTPSAR